MQITIKDAVIKQAIADTVERCLDRKDAKLVKEIMSDEKVMAKLAKALGAFINEQADVVYDMLEDIRIPALDREVKAQAEKG